LGKVAELTGAREPAPGWLVPQAARINAVRTAIAGKLMRMNDIEEK
jgi:hypothetical protein